MGEIGLFPLGVVLLPTERLPLHIFEERYKELIGECIEGGLDFGLVFAEGDELVEVGTRARVAQVLTRFPDGRLNVLVEGGGRFLVDELTDGRTFLTAHVSRLDDEDDPASPESIDRALGQFERLREMTGSEVESPAASEPQLSFAIAGRVELAAEAKLGLLRDLSERSRMETLGELLDAVIAGAERVRTASERASTNGRVELG
ncbi:MAG TPA: LON peptidase substrate-binding domain-containing protein [Gaiellaceae bacterium]|nr:LON peptidase substrate-binding domain-containing protein [Gaiellaceae bacterium]